MYGYSGLFFNSGWNRTEMNHRVFALVRALSPVQGFLNFTEIDRAKEQFYTWQLRPLCLENALFWKVDLPVFM